jgi:predicted Zn-dependent peptidase
MWDPFANFERIVLPNGLTVFASQVDREFEIFGFVVHAGSREDPVGREGLAHFVEHCVSDNVPEYPPQKIKSYFKNQGGSINLGNINYLRTFYRCKCQTGAKHIKHALDIMGAIIINATLTSGIEKQRKIILQEYRRDYPYTFITEIDQLRLDCLFPNHKLAQSLKAIGREEVIKDIKASDLQQYYDQFYTPANISVVAIGKLSHDDVIEFIEQSPFSRQKPGKRIPPAPPKNPDHSQRVRFDVKVSQLLKTEHKMEEGHYSSCVALPGNINKEAMSFVDRMLKKTLFQEVREKRGWAYEIRTEYICFQDLYEFMIDMSLIPIGLPSIEKLIDSCIETRLNKKGLFKQEKRQLTNAFMLLDSSYEEICRYSMDDIAIWHRIISNTETIDKYKKITQDDVAEIIEHLRPEKRITIITHP